MFYRPDGTASLGSLMRVTGELDGKSGSFDLLGTGTYDSTSARVDGSVIARSGTGDLVGISGTAESVSTQADYPHMPLKLTYDLE